MHELFEPKLLIWILLQLGYKLSYRQVQYWDKTKFLKPSHTHLAKHPTLIERKDGSKTETVYRDYTIDDLRFILIIIILRAHKFSIQRQRIIIPWLREQFEELNFPIEELVIVAEGNLRLSLHHGNDQTWRFEKSYPAKLVERTVINLQGLTTRVDKILYPERYPQEPATATPTPPIIELGQAA